MDTFDELAMAGFLGKAIVVDTQGPLLYIGTLAEVRQTCLVLVEADVHDRHDSSTTKELYVQESFQLGVRVNRARVLVMREQVASVSLLADVVN